MEHEERILNSRSAGVDPRFKKGLEGLSEVCGHLLENTSQGNPLDNAARLKSNQSEEFGASEMENMMGQLNPSKRRKILYEGSKKPVKGGTNVENTVIEQMQFRKPYDTFCPINDIVSGVCRLDHYSQKTRNTPLSQNKIYDILSTIELINKREVKSFLGVADRQAQVYVKALGIIVPELEKLFEEDEGDLDFVELDDYET